MKKLILKLKILLNLSDRPVEEVLALVAESKYYDESSKGLSSKYMCIALKYAYKGSLISEKEFYKCTKEIAKYISSRRYLSLEQRLIETSLPSHFEACKAVYKDWENRPKLKLNN